MAETPAHIRVAHSPRKTSRRFGILRALVPFLRPHRTLIIAGTMVLLITTLVSLALPLIVRQVVDQFNLGDLTAIDRCFGLALPGVTALAVGAALRVYVVARLGERVLMDLRNAIFGRVIGVSPAFCERLMTGEILSRITADTSVVQTVVGTSAAGALRNALTLVRAIFPLVTT